ncbi:hypothetical protein MTO96_028940, partial [Rhipicephalus appendiculatus]
VSTSEDQEVAVLFMDTQGLFDNNSTTAENAAIFALSVMTSSVQIYNISQNIQEDHLQHLEFFTQYGQLAQKVATAHSYDGCLEHIDQPFKNHLQEFVPWIIGPEHLVVKKINGKTITCQELPTYIQAYVEKFKSGELPEPKSMLQATAEASHLTAMQKAIDVYMTVMSNVPHGDLDKLRGLHKDALARAREVFDGMQKIGDYHTSKSYRDLLINQLQEYFGRLYEKEQVWLDQKNQEEKTRRKQEAEKERKRQKEKKLLEQKYQESLESLKSEKEEVEKEINTLTGILVGASIVGGVAAAGLTGGAALLGVAGLEAAAVGFGTAAGLVATGGAACGGGAIYREVKRKSKNAKKE